MSGTKSGHAPNSWVFLAVATVAISIAGVLTTALLVRYLNDRPLDLLPHTDYLSDRTYDVLVNNRIPPENIARGKAELLASDTAHWQKQDFVVEVPPTVSTDGLVEVLRRDMAQRRVYVKDLGEGESVRRIGLAFSGQEFAEIELRGGRESRVGPRDLTEESEALAQAVRTALERGLPAGTALDVRIPERRQSDSAIWSLTRIMVSVAPEQDAPDLVTILRAAIVEPEATVEPLPPEAPAPGAAVTYDGYLCVEVVAQVADEANVDADAEAGADPEDVQPMPFNEELPDLDAPVSSPEEESALPLDSAGLESSLLGAPSNGMPDGDPSNPRVAIIIDDGGNNYDVDSRFLALDPGLTFAILPFTPNAKKLAREAAALGFEVMLHMPMESSNGRVDHPGIVRVAMDATEIADMTSRALEEVPGVEGINNHTGSYFTEMEPALRAVFDVVKARKLYFIDSRTSANSVAPALARDMEIPVAIRDVFLDNESDATYIAGQFEELIAKAKKRGYAVGIGHFRPATLVALADLLPRLAEENIALVHASELVQ